MPSEVCCKEKSDTLKKQSLHHVRSKIAPYILFPAMIGVLTGVLIFLFKIASSWVMKQSANVYTFVRENPKYFPLLVLGIAALGACSALILIMAKECRGGGIPTAIASIRGLIPLKWVQGIFVLFGSALLTYFAGVPLGNEGPSVQMGTAVGKGSAELLGNKKRAWERYTMTGGACSGFAIATGAPLTGIIFALEEAHRRFSPAIFIVVSTSVLTGTVTQGILSAFFHVNTTFFGHVVAVALPLKDLWAAALIGVVCGVCALLFTKAYRWVRQFGEFCGKKIPFFAKIVLIFAMAAVLGFACEDFVGSGHSLIEKILEGHTIWYIILLAFIVRAVLMISANVEGVCGGLFVPTLAFGAMIAALVAEALVALGLVGAEYYPILVVVGMASFMASSSRTPLTAIAFTAEALCLASNILPAVIGVAIAYVIAEMSGKLSFTDTVIEARAEAAHKEQLPIIIDSHMTVQPDAFAIGMELRDILWPPTCVVLSIDKSHTVPEKHTSEIQEGDVLHLHYQTYAPKHTMQILTHILGDQTADKKARIHFGSEEHIVPLE